jgi:hypothetical protein
MDERELTVSLSSEDTKAGCRYRLTIWKPGGGIGLPIAFSNRARAERVKRVLEREMQPEFQREDAEIAGLLAALTPQPEEGAE